MLDDRTSQDERVSAQDRLGDRGEALLWFVRRGSHRVDRSGGEDGQRAAAAVKLGVKETTDDRRCELDSARLVAAAHVGGDERVRASRGSVHRKFSAAVSRRPGRVVFCAPGEPRTPASLAMGCTGCFGCKCSSGSAADEPQTGDYASIWTQAEPDSARELLVVNQKNCPVNLSLTQHGLVVIKRKPGEPPAATVHRRHPGPRC